MAEILVLKLMDYPGCVPDDDYAQRPANGWKPGLPDEDIIELNRWCWDVGVKRGAACSHVLFWHTGKVRAIAEITGIYGPYEQHRDGRILSKKAIEVNPLGPGDEAYERWYDQPVPQIDDGKRSVVRYFTP
ncbi:hypothetical protein ACQKM2_08965 [Streptomyces sp. NPDC004126]|uniref:hypothetical protein n=1 Tax=Streptomyces sp. NPDC004126 TaxID=3390695 RepID=UPI003D076DB9